MEPRIRDVLARAPLFAGLPPHVLADLASRCTERHLRDGAYLFHINEPADRLYVLAEGTFEVVRGAPGSDQVVVLNVLGAGTVVGELAILRSEPRSASVRVKGPAVVYEMEALTFLHYARRSPELALSLARSVADAFVVAERRNHEARAPVWAVMTADAIAPTFPVELARAALAHRKGETSSRLVYVLAPAPAEVFQAEGFRVEVKPLVFAKPREVAALVRTAIPKSALVVVAAPLPALADILGECAAVIGGAAATWPELGENAVRITMLASGAPSATRVRIGPRAAERVARLLLRRSIGVALSGGVARGLAQLGVLAGLESLGVPVDFIVGTSMGATVAGFYLANGLERTMALVHQLSSPVGAMRRFLDPAVRSTGVIDGHRLLAYFEKHLTVERIEDLEIPYGAVALDLDTGDEFVARAGRIADAMRASGVMPGLVAPYSYQPPGAAKPGRYVDGSLVNLVPVDTVRALGADRVVGVHVMHVRDMLGPAELPLGPPSTEHAMTIMQAHLLGLARAGERQVFAADVAILPDAGGFGLGEIWRGREIIEVGRAAALAAGERLRALTR